MAAGGPQPGALGTIYAQITAGVPQTLRTLGDKFAIVLTALEKVQGEIPDEMGRLAKEWRGPAATTFGKVGEQITVFIGDTAEAITNDKAVMLACADALDTARAEIQDLADQWNAAIGRTNPPFNPEMAAWEAAAQAILDKVSDAYKTQGGNLKEIKEDPGDITANGEGVDDPGADGDGDLPDDDEDVPGEEPPAGGGGPGDNALLAPGGEPIGPDGEPLGPDGEPIGPGGDPTGIGAPDLPEGPGTDGLQTDGPGDPGNPGDPTDDGPFGGIGNPGGPDFLTSPSDGDGPTPPELQGIGNPDGDAPTKLSSFDPGGPNLTAPSPVGGGDLPTTLTSAPNAAGTGPVGGGGLGGGPGGRPLIGPVGPGSQLTSAGLRGGPGGTPSARGSRGGPGTGGPVGPGSTLTSAGGRSRSGATRSKRGGLGGFGDPDDTGYFPARAIGDTDDEAEERESWLLGDEEWDDSEALESSIGRPGGDHADVGS